jgi:hypothetical protein
MAKTNGRPYPLIPKGKKLQVTDRPGQFILSILLYMCISYACIHYVSYMFINAEIFRDHEYLKMYIYIYIYLS